MEEKCALKVHLASLGSLQGEILGNFEEIPGYGVNSSGFVCPKQMCFF